MKEMLYLEKSVFVKEFQYKFPRLPINFIINKQGICFEQNCYT